jgi:hypothetical protein
MKRETTMWASACDGPQHDAGDETDEWARALDYRNGNRNLGTGRGGEGTFGTCGDSKRRWHPATPVMLEPGTREPGMQEPGTLQRGQWRWSLELWNQGNRLLQSWLRAAWGRG